MNTYSYAALAGDNSYVKGQLKERTLKKASAKLEAEGFMIINIKKDITYKWNKFLHYSTITRKDKIYFTRHLVNFLEAGIALDQSIKICQEQITNKRFQQILKEVHKNILGGQSLYHSLLPHIKIFSAYFINMIRVGEESGKLDTTLHHLLEKQEKEYELLVKTRGA